MLQRNVCSSSLRQVPRVRQRRQQHVQAAGRSDVSPQTAGLRQATRRQLLSLGVPTICSCCFCSGRLGWYDATFAASMATGMTEYEAAVAPLKQVLFQLLLSGRAPPASTTPATSGSSSAADSGADSAATPCIPEGLVPEGVPTSSGRTSSTSSTTSSNRSSKLLVLEVGIGTGPNLPYYGRSLPPQQPPDLLQVVGVDPNPAMQSYARQAAAAAGLAPEQLQLVVGDAAALPFDDSSFDAAVVTLVLCSVKDPLAVLQEIKRVVVPGGKLLLVEHTLFPQPGWLQLQQRLLDPLQQLLADGCHLTRNPRAALEQAGWQQARDCYQLKQFWDASPPRQANGDVLPPGVELSEVQVGQLLQLQVPGVTLISPHVAGVLSA